MTSIRIKKSIERVLADYNESQSKLNLENLDEIKSKNQILKSQLDDSNAKIKELEDALAKQLAESNKAIRDVAMDWISHMQSTLLDKALLGDEWFPFRLPQFPRAVKGDPDYPESTEPKEGILFYPKRRLTGRDLDQNMSNYAEAHREMLRWMSEEDFKKVCYKD